MMYHKFIGDREVFSTCKTLHTEEGWISNPTPEQIAADGWTEYIPPVVPPTPQTEPGMDDIIQAVKKMLSTGAEQLSDEDALEVAAVFPTWASKIGKVVPAGERLWDDSKLWKVLQPHTVQEDWRPANTPSLFVEVSIAEIREITDQIPAENPFMKDEKGRWKGEVYVSLKDNNVWTPDAYPAGWKKI